MAMEIKDRMKLKRHKMPEQDPKERITNFNEVPLGLGEKIAIAEANRCLNCKHQPCVDGCPVKVKIPDFLMLITEGKFIEAARKIKETNALPAVCGRVCPQEEQCEMNCVRGKTGKPVAVGYLERFVADYERNSGNVKLPKTDEKTGYKIAIIGSGPSGLTAAGDLIKKGHDITVFEALHKAGGVLVYGIPEFRLPKKIVSSEVEYLKKLGVKVVPNKVIGASKSIDEIMKEEGFDAVFVGVGAGLPMFLGLPGENLNGVYSANEYLTRANLMRAYDHPKADTPIVHGKNVTVIGGGNVAMDCLRTALRLGANNVHCIYRRTMEEMPARNEEIEHAKEEGIKFNLLRNPVRLIGNEDKKVEKMEVLKMELGEPDPSGRRRPIPITDSEFTIETDLVIFAIGAGANPLLTSTMPDIRLNKWGYIVTDTEGRTSKPGVWAGGDIVTGAATVILAAGAGKEAAHSINEWLLEENRETEWPFDENEKING